MTYNESKKRGDADMAHVENYKMKAIKDILKEHDRQLEKYKNDVDVTRSYLNYSYGRDGEAANLEDVTAFFTDSVKSFDTAEFKRTGKHLLNNNSKPVSEWVVTYPKRYCEQVAYKTTDKDGNEVIRHYWKPKNEEHCKMFFDEVFSFTQSRYDSFEYNGNTYDRVGGAWVNMDETTPHMHIASLALAKSKFTGNLTFSASSFMPKRELKAYQKEMENHMREFFKVDDFGLLDEDKYNQPELTDEQNADYTHTAGKVSTENLKLMTDLQNKIDNQEALIDDKANDKANEIMGRKMKKYIKELKPDTTDDSLDKMTVNELADTLRSLYENILTVQRELEEREEAQKKREKDFQGKEDRLEALQKTTEEDKQRVADKELKLNANAKKLHDIYKTAKQDRMWLDKKDKEHAEAIKGRAQRADDILVEAGFDRQFNE